MKCIVFCTMLLLATAFDSLRAQVTSTGTPAAGDTTMQVIDIIHADRLGFRKVDSVTEIQTAAGKVVFRNEKTIFNCDSCVYDKNKKVIEAFGHVQINDADSVHTKSDYLIYYVDKKLALLKKNVVLTDGKGTLTTNELEYQTQVKIGTYRNGGKVVNGKTILTSEEAVYYSEMKDAYFKKNVKMRDPQYNLDTDSLLYNTETQVATFITKTNIEDSSKRTIVTDDGFYDMKNKNARFGGRAIIKDGGVILSGNEIVFDELTGDSYARGNAVYKDSAQGVSVLANDFKANKKKGSFLATQHPLMIMKQDKDSTFLTADTLFSGRLTDMPGYRNRSEEDTLLGKIVLEDNDSTNRNRYFNAYHHVRIFSDSLQAVSDSLFYSGVDSVFRLFNNPIAWTGMNQITGDTIYLFTKNKKPSRLFVFENGLMINKVGDNFFNQIKGNTLNGYFKDGDIDYMRSKGSAESVYYAQDEKKAFAGVNKTIADIIDMQFVNKELNKVTYRGEGNGTTYPFGQVNHDEMKLRGFKWQDKRRPKTKFELFEELPPVVEEESARQ